MSKTLAQVFALNPTTIVADTDLFYLVHSPYTIGNDSAILGSDLKSQFGSGTVNTGLINQIAYYATSGSTVSGLTTAANGMLVTNPSGTPSILAGPGTTGNILQSNAAAAPSFSTATYPSIATNAGRILRADGTNWVESISTFADTYFANSLLYANSVNNVSGLATVNRSVLSTNATGVPTWLPLANGQIVIGSTAGAPLAASLTAGSGITITPGSNSITISASIGTGTVTSISAGTGITLTPNPITTTGSVALTVPVSVTSGGTGLITTTINQILYSSAANTIAGLVTANNGLLVTSNTGIPSILAGPGTTGNILQSNASAAPSFSTSTFPSTAGTAGNVIISNGTNYVSSTSLWPNTVGTSGKVVISDGTSNVYSTPTFPNISAASGKIIISDGTNWVASTPTYPNSSGSSGQLLRSDGINNVYSTSTYPNTNAINTLLYASAANVMSALPTANNGVLITNSSGIPSIAASIVASNLLPLGDTGVSTIGSLSKNLADASTTQTITGLAFRPSLVIFLGNVNAALTSTWGFDNGSLYGSVVLLTSGSGSISTTNSINFVGSAGNSQVGRITAFTSDGFTITWTKAGVITGTGVVVYLAFK